MQSEWPRSGKSRRSVIAEDLWYCLTVACETDAGAVRSFPPAVTSSGPRVALRVSTLAGEPGQMFATAASNSGLPGDGIVQRSYNAFDSSSERALPKP